MSNHSFIPWSLSTRPSEPCLTARPLELCLSTRPACPSELCLIARPSLGAVSDRPSVRVAEVIEERGLKPLQDVLEKMEGWPVVEGKL